MNATLKAVLYYDGACPLCRREMELLARRKTDKLELIDVHSDPQLSPSERVKMLRQLHLRQADGQWLVGVDASVAAWRDGGLGWLLAPLRWPLLGPVVDRVYRRWAERRFHKLYGEGDTLCPAPEAANDQ